MYIYARTSRDIGPIIRSQMTYAQIPNASISLIIYRGVFSIYYVCVFVVCVCVCVMCQVLIIHNTYRLRLFNSTIRECKLKLASFIGKRDVTELLWHSCTNAHIHIHTPILSRSLRFFFFIPCIRARMI